MRRFAEKMHVFDKKDSFSKKSGIIIFENYLIEKKFQIYAALFESWLSKTAIKPILLGKTTSTDNSEEGDWI